MKKKFMYSLMLLAMMGLVQTGCAEKETPEAEVEATETPTAEPTPTDTPTPTPEEVLDVIGEESEDGYKIKLLNSTGLDIKEFSIKSTDEEVFPENFLDEEDLFTAGEKRYLYYNPIPIITLDEVTEAEEADEEESVEDQEKELPVGYDVSLTMSDDTVYILHAFPLEDIAEGEICLEDEVAYLKYTSITTEENVETKEAELAIKAQAEAEAEAEAQRQAEAEAEAEAQRQAEAEAEAAAEAQRQAEAEAAAEAQRQAEAEAAAEAQRQAEAEAAAEAQRQAEAEAAAAAAESNSNSGDEGCLDDGLLY